MTGVLGGDDDWDPQFYTEQAPIPTNVVLAGSELTWDNSDYVFCWAICKDGKVVDFTTSPAYTVGDTSAKWSVRAANEMGGLSEAVEASITDGIETLQNPEAAVSTHSTYDLMGRKVTTLRPGNVYIRDAKKYIEK